MAQKRATSNLETAALIIGIVGFLVTATVYWFVKGRSSQLGLAALGSIASVVAGGAVVATILEGRRAIERRKYRDTYRTLSRDSVKPPEGARGPTDAQRETLNNLLSAMAEEISRSQSPPLSSIKAGILVLRADGQTLQPIAYHPPHQSLAEPFVEVPLSDDGPIARAASKGEPYISFDAVAQRNGAPSWVIATPILVAGGKAVGVLVAQAVGDRPIEQGDAEKLRPSVSQMIYWSQLAGLILGGMVKLRGLGKEVT